MEISLTKKHLKNALALLMAFLIAMSTMWTGLSVVTFAVDGKSNVTSGNLTGGNVTGGIVIGGVVTGGNVDAPSGAVIKSGKCGSNVTFDLYENGVLVISGSGSMYSSSGNPFYSIRSKITSVIIENGVTSVGNNSFYYNYDKIKTVVISDSVKMIGNHAFYGCDALESVFIGNGVTSIGSYAFYGCYNINNVYATDIESWMKILFAGDYDSRWTSRIYSNPLCYGANLYFDNELATEVVIPEGATLIKKCTFYNCDSIKKVTIPETVTEIDDYAFYSCNKLQNVTIPESVKIIGDRVFYNCDSFTQVVIPDNVKTVGNYAYAGCDSLTDIKIGKGITRINTWTFAQCDSLETVTVPSNIKKIARGAFYDCDSLKSIVIPDTVTGLGASAFRGCGKLEDVTLPKNLKAIRAYLFYNCDSLKTVTLPDRVETIEKVAFRGCDSLTKIVIPDSVTSINGGAFYGCNSLESVTIPDNVTSISDSAFSRLTIHCNKNSVAEAYAKKKGYPYVLLDGGDEVNIVGGNIGKNFTWTLDKRTGLLEISGGGKLPYFTDKSPAPWEAYGDYITQVKLPDGLLVISNKSFENLKRVKNITIPDSVTIIDSYAFYNCYRLKSTTIPDSVTTIGSYAFSGCDSLTEVTIGDSVTTIGSYAFRYCDSLTEVTIGDSVTSIGFYAFDDCYSIESVYASDAESWIKIDFDYYSNPLFNGADLYFDGKLVTELVVPENTTEIKSYAFHNYKRLEKVSFNLDENYESKARTISYDAFTGCSGLREIILPASVGYIYSDAFPVTLEKITILNPECEINSSCGITYNSEVVGFKGSTAEAFADEKAAYFTDYETIHTHSYKVISDTKATCTQAGLFLERCSCGKENKEIREATGHDFKDFEVTLEPTCTSYGQRKAFCKNCDYYESQRIEPTYHENRENRGQQNPTCTSYGYTSGVYCPDCDTWLLGHALINPTSHAYTEKIIDNAHLVSEATAISPAVYKYDCVNCDSIGEETFTHGEASGLGKTSKITATQSTSAIKLTWKPVEEASGYIIFTWFDSSWEAVAITNATTHKFTGLPSGTKYKFAVLAYGNTNMGMLVLANNYTTISTATEADLPSSIKASQTTSTVTLKWSACEGATGYRVYQYSPSKGKYVQIASVKTTSYKKTGLKAGTDYKFKIKPYVKLDDGTVIWSEATDAFKTATKPATVTVKVSSTAAGKASLSWNAVTGADGYRVYYKTSGGSYKLLKTVGSSTKSLTVTGLKSGTKYAFYVKAGIKTDSGTIYGAYKAASVTVK